MIFTTNSNRNQFFECKEYTTYCTRGLFIIHKIQKLIKWAGKLKLNTQGHLDIYLFLYDVQVVFQAKQQCAMKPLLLNTNHTTLNSQDLFGVVLRRGTPALYSAWYSGVVQIISAVKRPVQ